MDSETAIEVTNLSKKYRLGTIGMTSLREDLSRLWNRKKTVEQPTAPNGTIDAPRKINDHEFWALKDLNFSIRKGEVIGLIGANGSGKSTLLKILSRITEPTKGSVKVRGRVASLLEVGTGFHPELTGRENVYVNGAILGMTRKEVTNKFDEIVDFAGVSDFIDTPIKRYSSGMTVRLGFAVAAHLDPDILIVDEVLAVGDASFQEKCIGKMKNVSSGGKTILLVSHQMPMIENLCSQCILLKDGNLDDYSETKKIISKYHSRINKFHNNVLSERRDRNGSGDLTIEDFNIYNSKQKKKSFIRCGDKATIIFKTKSNRNFNGNVTISIGINDYAGKRITQLNSKITKDALNLHENNCDIKLEITKVNLLPNIYSFNIFLSINETISDWIINAGEITVIEGDYYKSGILPDSNQGYLLMDYRYTTVKKDLK